MAGGLPERCGALCGRMGPGAPGFRFAQHRLQGALPWTAVPAAAGKLWAFAGRGGIRVSKSYAGYGTLIPGLSQRGEGRCGEGGGNASLYYMGVRARFGKREMSVGKGLWAGGNLPSFLRGKKVEAGRPGRPRRAVRGREHDQWQR